ncbi:acetylornithine and succinylornithine aminotransferase [Methanohalobium evestigatum Z-7303]|uniref:Acetylornithine aminotransferase n=1 Tax=Methanohalobium evestigatum (strain ATCC BAA-1072 / DSM 3721 / NBRC 107634 / OCM 161 / Z-7303) TaxID=644295 RepID=D7EBQ7_METEZ|nr:acetylornithine and succinylornithine aminotransferase [Methanohalobium evestigatum Z-7303]
MPGSETYESIVSRDEKYVMQNYTRQPIALKKGEGAVVYDVDDNQYIDCLAGIAVNNVGHCHPNVVNAIKKQSEQLIHVSNLYYTQIQTQLAEKLVELTEMDRIFFCNSGAEAIESAMKLARSVSKKTDFVAAEQSFHGRTIGSLSVTHKEKFRKPFAPLIEDVNFVPYNDSQAVADSITNNTAAVIVEPIQGEGGVNIPSNDYLKELRKICDDTGTLLIFDEVQTGFGRTGKWFCKQHSGVQPDIMAMAKAMGGGFPIGAIASKEGITFDKGEHASTFGGNPLACAASLGAIRAIEDDSLVQRSKELGDYFVERLKNISRDDVVEVRGRGLMIGMELKSDCKKILNYARENGVLLNCTSDSVLRIVPPLVITSEQIDKVVDVIEQA